MQEAVTTNREDPVSSLFETVRVKATLFCRSALRAPWGFSVTSRDVLTYHLVVSGQCCFEIDGQPPVGLEAGDLVVLTRGDPHSVRDAAGTLTQPLESLLSSHPLDELGNLRVAGPGTQTFLLCGAIELEDRHANPLIALLPRLLRVNTRTELWLGTLVDSLDTISLSARPARSAIVNHLGSLLFIGAVQNQLDADPRLAGSAAALGDSRIMQASLLMIQKPELNWDVGRLAARVGMSRSGLSRLFSQRVGQSPGEFLRRCRIARAMILLRDERRTLHDIASTVGYRSTPAFSRAFKTVIGMTPGKLRGREAEHPPVIEDRKPPEPIPDATYGEYFATSGQCNCKRRLIRFGPQSRVSVI